MWIWIQSRIPQKNYIEISAIVMDPCVQQRTRTAQKFLLSTFYWFLSKEYNKTKFIVSETASTEINPTFELYSYTIWFYFLGLFMWRSHKRQFIYQSSYKEILVSSAENLTFLVVKPSKQQKMIITRKKSMGILQSHRKPDWTGRRGVPQKVFNFQMEWIDI